MLAKSIGSKFKNVFKVFKYEFKHASKTLIPMYCVLLVLGLFIGLLQSPLSDIAGKLSEASNQYSDENGLYYEFNSEQAFAENYSKVQTNFLKGLSVVLLSILFSMYTTALFIVTIVILARRFRISMLGDEAYLNLTLPVSIGEHLWGRYLSAIAWTFLCIITLVASSLLCMIRNKALTFIPEFFEKANINIFESLQTTPGMMIFLEIVSLFASISSIILLMYCINALGSLAPRFKTLIKFSSAIVLLIITSKLTGSFTKLFQDNMTFNLMSLISILVHLFMCIVYTVTTHLIFTKNLNLE